jgi:predicted ATPase
MSTASDPVPFVGRDAELAQLTTAFATAAAARGGLLLLAGEPGIGKTTLCQRLVAVVAT